VKYIPPPEKRERIDKPLLEVFDRGDEPDTWDRASIKANTHPLHPTPRVTQDDLLLPRRADRVKLVGDCVLFGLALLGLCAFPVYVASIVVDGFSPWLWFTCVGVGALGAVWLYARASAITDREYLESL
jgi:hypothetical protein